jgi:hypothetical protein
LQWVAKVFITGESNNAFIKLSLHTLQSQFTIKKGVEFHSKFWALFDHILEFLSQTQKSK